MGRASRSKRERRLQTATVEAPETPAPRSDGLGSVAVLNVGAGDLKLSFDKANPAERKRAASIVRDMLKRGYAILVQVDEKDGEPVYQRAKRFDAERCEYVVIGTPDALPGPVAEEVTPERTPTGRKPNANRGRPWSAARRAQSRERRIAADQTRTVAVARSAGG